MQNIIILNEYTISFQTKSEERTKKSLNLFSLSNLAADFIERADVGKPGLNVLACIKCSYLVFL